MNIKCTLLKLLGSLIISPIVVYAVLVIARFFGADYEMSHGESFIIWLLMAILISQSWVWKK
jgi:hypothetical protein|tara:strand:- start:168 stop:353 length:186 start_codon:yes stop_codon:yes gene_type:complete